MMEKKEVFDIDHEVCKLLASWVGVRESFERLPQGGHAEQTSGSSRYVKPHLLLRSLVVKLTLVSFYLS